MKQDGCTKVAMTNDKEVYGAGLAENIELAAKPQGLNIISNEAIDKTDMVELYPNLFNYNRVSLDVGRQRILPGVESVRHRQQRELALPHDGRRR